MRVKPDVLVPDLSPEAHPERKWARIGWVFVAESPHVHEISPPALQDRRPLCGMAGKKWWGALSEIIEGKRSEDVSLDRLLDFCASRGIAVLNAVQCPLDPGIVKKVAHADPVRVLGFSKASGPYSYKKMRESSEVKEALDSLRQRLEHPRLAKADLFCLGLDAEWFVVRALGQGAVGLRLHGRIPHPSAWWRKGGYFGRLAREQLEKAFN